MIYLVKLVQYGVDERSHMNMHAQHALLLQLLVFRKPHLWPHNTSISFPARTTPMGLLKHGILPYFACLHAYVFASIFIVGSKMDFARIISANTIVGDKLTPLENNLFGAAGAFHCAVGFACVMGVITEHSHFRGIMVFMELIQWTLNTYDAYQSDFPYSFMLVQAVIAAVGLLIHSLEPGIFTKDKSKEKEG
jgi:hypothetical protein